MNRTILTVAVALLMLGLPASAKVNDVDEIVKEDIELTESSMDSAECGLGAGVHLLTLGVSTSSTLPSIVGASCEFSVTPNAGGGTHTRVVLNGMLSDFDLYVKRGGIPTTTDWECRPFSGGTTAETCEVLVNGADVGIMVRRFSGSGPFTVTATMSSPPPTCSLGWVTTPLSTGTPQSASLTTTTNAQCHFSYTPTGSADLARFTVPPTSPANFNLYVRAGAAPTTSVYDCRSLLSATSTETCDVFNSGATLYAMVIRSTGSGAFSITASDVTVPELQNGAPTEVRLTGTGTSALFKLVVPEGASLAQFTLLPADETNVGPIVCHAVGGGIVPCAPDADLYVRRAALPTTTAFDCRPYPYGNVESCTFSDEVFGATGRDPGAPAGLGGLSPGHVAPFNGAGKYFVMLRSFSGAPHVHITGTSA